MTAPGLETWQRVRRNVAILRYAASASETPADAIRLVRLFRRVQPFTGLGLPRLAALVRLSAAIEREGIAGAVVECGTCKGGSAAVLASATARSARPLWLFDSFEGLPPPTREDGEEAKAYTGLYRGEEGEVRDLLKSLGIPEERIHLVKGWFEETLPKTEVGPIALLHVDADWYDSVKAVLRRFWDDVRPGGYVVLDDYGRWEGCRRATDEFLKSRGIAVPLVRVDFTGVWLRKPREAREGAVRTGTA